MTVKDVMYFVQTKFAKFEDKNFKKPYKSVDYFIQIANFLQAIYSHFSYSSMQTERLKSVFVCFIKNFSIAKVV